MNRRDAFIGAGGALFATLQTAAVAQEMAHDHAHMHSAGKYQALIDSTSDCVVKGQACVAHCLVLLGEGDKQMAGCAKSVEQVLAVCGALQALAAQDAPLTPALAKLAIDACQQCEKECRKHEDKHAQCKACADSCANCAKQCKAIAV